LIPTRAVHSLPTPAHSIAIYTLITPKTSMLGSIFAVASALARRLH
jgi:hypothetical protein